MAIFQKDIEKIVKQLVKKSPKSRTYNTFLHRLEKKIERLKRYTRTRANDKTLETVEELEAGYEATIPEDMKAAFKKDLNINSQN